MHRNKISRIKLTGLQVKSLSKAKKLAKALDIIEIECGINCVEIMFDDFFLCPHVRIKKLNKTAMEKLIRNVFKDMRKT